MKQISENLFVYSFRARRIMFLCILHSLYFYCSPLFYHSLLLKVYKKFYFYCYSFSIRTFSLRLLNYLHCSGSCPVLPAYFSFFCYIPFLILINPEQFPMEELVSFCLFHHDPSKFLSSDHFRSSHSLLRRGMNFASS